jgi:hypothetical protein
LRQPIEWFWNAHRQARRSDRSFHIVYRCGAGMRQSPNGSQQSFRRTRVDERLPQALHRNLFDALPLNHRKSFQPAGNIVRDLNRHRRGPFGCRSRLLDYLKIARRKGVLTAIAAWLHLSGARRAIIAFDED